MPPEPPKTDPLKELHEPIAGRPSYYGQIFFGLQDRGGFVKAINAAFACILPGWRRGIFTGDNLITFSKNLSFLSDQRFMDAVRRHADTDIERSILWRTAVLVWAARNGLRREGDFVECGCYRGTSAHIVCDALDFGATGRGYWLYDLFEYPEGSTHTHMPGMGAELFETTKARFAHLPQVRVIRGAVPGALEGQSPEKIAFLHIDMNNVAAEIGALEALFDRVAPGGAIVLDDYGYYGYVAQRDAERAWFAERGYDVIELPTSQGLIIK
jgi:hypothetical protein